MAVIDRATFEELKQMSGDDFINELIDAFLDDGPNMLANMQTALNAKDVESFRRNAHSLKTNANTFGVASGILDIARNLHLSVVFLGADNHAIERSLLKMHVRYAAGDLYGAPISERDLVSRSGGQSS